MDSWIRDTGRQGKAKGATLGRSRESLRLRFGLALAEIAVGVDSLGNQANGLSATLERIGETSDKYQQGEPR